MTKKILALLLAAIMVVGSITGCTNNKPQTGGEGKDISAELTLWCYPRFDTQDSFFDEEVMAEFNKQYPNIKLTTTTIPWEGGPEKVNMAIGSKTTPDILLDADMRLSSYAAKGVLVPLTDVIGANAEGMSDSWTNAVVIDGQQYLAPVFTSGGTAMAINVALVEEYGLSDMLPEDHVSWTWDQFYAFCKAATEAGKADGIYSIAMFAGSQSSDSNTMGWLMGSGATVLNEDLSGVALNTADAGKVLDNMAKLVTEGIAMPGATTLIDDECIELFLSGKTFVCQYADLWTINQAYERKQNGEIAVPMEAQYYLFPTLDGKPKTYLGYGATGFCVFNNGDENKIAAAKAFIDFFMGSEFEGSYIEQAGQLACREGIELYTDKETVSAEAARMSSFGKYYALNWGSQLGFWAEVRSTFYPEIQAVYTGAKSGQEALNSFAANANKVIEKIRKSCIIGAGEGVFSCPVF